MLLKLFYQNWGWEHQQGTQCLALSSAETKKEISMLGY